MFRGIDEKKFLPAMVVCFCLFCGLLLVFAFGCAVRHLPGGGTQPASAFEQVLAWNAALAQANSGFADNVIGLQRTGFLEIQAARGILVKQATIAQADKRITDRISAAALCGADSAGANAAPAQLDAATAKCAQISGPGIAADINLITGAIADLNSAELLAVKDQTKRQALADLLSSIGALVGKIYRSLETQGVVKTTAFCILGPPVQTAMVTWTTDKPVPDVFVCEVRR